MTTQAGAPHLLSRVMTRAGLGLWRNRGGIIVAVLATVIVGGYASLTWTGAMPASLRGAAVASANTDCADAAIAAMADKAPAVAQRAYQCMDATFQQRVTEADFVRQMQTQTTPAVSKLARVGDYHTASGGSLVYYALDATSGQSVGYVVYVGQNGKVLRIE